MSLRNEHIGLAVGMVILLVGEWLTGWDPSQKEGALIAFLFLGSALGISLFLNEREYRRSPRR